MTHSYGQILRSSSIMGGAQAINYLVSLLRVKVAAVLLGPAGVGIIGLYTTATSLMGTVTGLGLQGSAVRAIAQAQGAADPIAVARTVAMLRRLCWLTGLLGWLASLALAVPLSRLMFESGAHAWALAALGALLLMNALSGGQSAMLQGMRRIGDIARMQVAGAILNTALTLALYAWLRERGIVPALIANAAVSLGLSWWFARRVVVQPASMRWSETLAEARPMLALGAAMMWSGVLSLMVDLYTRTLISRQLGLEAAGLYQAAWALSGLFAGFVLTAMGTDFYPRLTAVIADREAATRAVNEQTEIGILLALPGLLGTLALAKWVVWALYSAEFAPAADVLAWMVLGVFGRVLSWPLGYILLAKSAVRWLMITEATFLVIQAALVAWLVPRHGVVGAAYAFAACYALHTAAMAWVGHRLIGFRWSPAAIRLMLIASLLVLAAMVANRLLADVPAVIVGCALAAVGSVWSLRGLARRLGPAHSLVLWMQRIPCIREIVRFPGHA
jgi:PST family polysaccharide transporter